MLHSNTSTTAAQNHGYYLMHLRNQNQRFQTDGIYMSSLSQSVVNQQSQHQVPPCLQCHDGSYLSLSALQYLKLPGKTKLLRLQSQGHQCKRPSSSTVPAHYRTSGIQLLTSYLTHVAIQFFHEPRSLTKQI